MTEEEFTVRPRCSSLSQTPTDGPAFPDRQKLLISGSEGVTEKAKSRLSCSDNRLSELVGRRALRGAQGAGFRDECGEDWNNLKARSLK